MKLHFIIFVTSLKETDAVIMQKTFVSTIRPMIGDIIDDPGFSPSFHNGYEFVKVTINYATEECWVSLTPLLPERTDISISKYAERLKTHGWKCVPKCKTKKTNTE